MTSGDPEPRYRGVEYPSLENSPPPADASANPWPGQWGATPSYPPPHPPGYLPPAPGYGQYGGYSAPKPLGTNTNAIIAVVASSVGVVLCGATAILGLILGIIAMRETRRTGQDGHGIALAAVIIGAVVVAFWVIYFVVIAGIVFATPQWAP